MKYPSRGTITLNSASCFLQCVKDVWRVDGVYRLLSHLQHDPGPSLHPLRLQDQVSFSRIPFKEQSHKMTCRLSPVPVPRRMRVRNSSKMKHFESGFLKATYFRVTVS
jgi:hypothetical protein